MPKGYRPAKDVAEGLLAAIETCKFVVAQFASGRVTVQLPLGTRYKDIRYAPGYQRGLPADTPGVPYTVGLIAEYLLKCGLDGALVNNSNGRFTANRYIVLAMRVLESIELGITNEDFFMENLKAGRIRIQPLIAELRARLNSYHETKEIVAIFESIPA